MVGEGNYGKEGQAACSLEYLTEMLGKPATYQHPRRGRNWTLELHSRWRNRTVIFPRTGHVIADFNIIYNFQRVEGEHLSFCVVLRIVVPLASLLIKLNPEDQNPKLTSSPSKKQKEWGSQDKVTLRFSFIKFYQNLQSVTWCQHLSRYKAKTPDANSAFAPAPCSAL